MRTENRIPNAKVVAMTLAMLIYGWLNHVAQSVLGLEIPFEVATMIGAAIIGIVGYVVPPRKGDGIEE